MRLRSSVLLAIRFLFPLSKGSVSNARRSLFGAVLCVGLSLIPLVVVLVVSSGMIEGITARIIGLSSYDIQAVYFNDSGITKNQFAEVERAAAVIEKCEGVSGAYIERQGLALAAGKTARSGVTIRAVSANIFERNTSFSSLFTIHEGTLSFLDSSSVLIGKKLAEITGVGAGDVIRLITLRERSGGGITPRLTSHTVAGVISSGYQELDSLWVFMPLETGFELLSGANSKVLIGVQTKNVFSQTLPMLAAEIERKLPSGFGVFTWRELNESQYENFESTRVMLLFIMMLIVLTSSANVSSALVMLVMERRREIAILKSFGASPSGITAAFVFAGVCTGIGGVLVGLPLGLLFAVNINQIIVFIEKLLNILMQSVYILWGETATPIPVHLLDPAYYLEKIPVTIPFFELFVIAAGTIVLSAAVSFIPAVRSGKEKPLTILRKF